MTTVIEPVEAVLVEVGQHQGHRLADQPATVDGQAVVAAQHQPGLLEVEQLVGGDVDGHLLVVPHPAAGLAGSGGLGVVDDGPDAALALLKQTIDKVRERLNPRLEVDGVLGTMFDGRTLHSREVMERLVSAWGDKVFHTVIRRTVKFSDSTVAGEPITSYASTSTGAEAYRQLAKEVLTRWPAE